MPSRAVALVCGLTVWHIIMDHAYEAGATVTMLTADGWTASSWESSRPLPTWRLDGPPLIKVALKTGQQLHLILTLHSVKASKVGNTAVNIPHLGVAMSLRMRFLLERGRNPTEDETMHRLLQLHSTMTREFKETMRLARRGKTTEEARKKEQKAQDAERKRAVEERKRAAEERKRAADEERKRARDEERESAQENPKAVKEQKRARARAERQEAEKAEKARAAEDERVAAEARWEAHLRAAFPQFRDEK